jgi:hypothetical protein
MKQEMKWGAAAAIAVAAAIGISSQSPGRGREGAPSGGQARQIAEATPKRVRTACSDLIDLFQAFLLRKVVGPPFCYEPGDRSAKSTTDNSKNADFQPKFVIATLPDPLHTHFSLLFDRFIEAIQQGAQDEWYEYDSSWLPWETEEPTLITLRDQDEADERKKRREDQPGVLLFHATPKQDQAARVPYQQSLVVFIIGEDPTDGLHRKQFENTLKWIAALQGDRNQRTPVAILGPTFSGSFPSLAQLLSDNEVHRDFRARSEASGKQLAIYSGSATGKDAVTWFSNLDELKDLGISFRSFLQDDDTVLDRFCRYLEGRKLNKEKAFDLQRLAVLSEDETAYGHRGPSAICKGAPWLYYPRDISTLRAAYQKQSIFNSRSANQQSQETAQPRSLSTDLADLEGKEYDTVRTYAGNQTPLSQEAELLGIVGALRSYRSQYVVLRSSNTLDPLFLANFLRREYPEARVVILNSDLLYQRGQDAMALGGVLTLSTYPLLPWERQLIARPPFSISSHRVFPEHSTEGTYIALRLLLQSRTFEKPEQANCRLTDNDRFLPSIFCKPEMPNAPIPDYAPPFWTEPIACGENTQGEACKPATWLSVITGSGSWPLAALNDHTLPPPEKDHCVREALLGSHAPAKPDDRPEWPSMPLSIKLFLVFVLVISIFHAACCQFASFTAKPAFRAHFATPGWRHRVLIFLGSLLIALAAIITGWGCGAFSWTGGPLKSPWIVRSIVFVVWALAGFSIIANALVTRRLNEEKANPKQDGRRDPRFQRRVIFLLLAFGLSLGMAFLAWILPLECALTLASRIAAYWRSMNLTSGVSPLVPFLLLTFGLYIWFWYSLHGLALFGPDRPRLPRRTDLLLKVPAVGNEGEHELDILPMFCQECAGKPVEDAATPLAWGTLGVNIVLFIVCLGLVTLVAREVPVRSLAAKTYAIMFCLWLDFCFSLILGAAWQLWRTWSRLRQLLVFLDRMPLRRTLASLRGFSWGTVWKMSGNVLDVRYKLLSRQLESLNHLHTSLQDLINADSGLDSAELKRVDNCLAVVDECRKAGIVFAEWFSINYRNPNAGLGTFQQFQEQIARTAGRLLTDLLVPEWRKEKHSLILVRSAGSDKEGREQSPPESTQEHIRNSEELICLTYLGFAQNILGRIRTIALGGLFLFVSTTLSVSSYPFDPRPALSGVLLLLFVMFGAVIVFVYADMHRDATLSHITNTNPGELGSEFWFKIIGFGAAPLFGLITTLFPELSGLLFTWLQPGLTSLK